MTRTSLLIAAALLAGSIGAAAQSPPPTTVAAATSVEGCLKQAFELADKIEGKELSDADLQRLEDMLTAMENHCESNQFAEAATVGRTIARELDVKRE